MGKSLIYLIIGMIMALIFFTYSSNDSKKNKVSKEPACRELSTECELQKHFAALKILKFSENASCVDVLGNPLVVGKWYIRINVTGVLLPVAFKNSADAFNVCNVGVSELNALAFPFCSENSKKEIGKVLINSGASVEAEILLTGKNELYIGGGDLSQQLILNFEH